MTPRLRILAIVLGLLHLPILLAGVFAPYPYAEQHRDFAYQAPAWRVPQGCGAAPEPCGRFLLGTDAFGRDILSRLLYGGRVSILAGLAATLLAIGLGTAAGILAGYCGGWVDALLMRGGELFMALPWLYFLLAVRAFLPLNISPAIAFFVVVSIVGTMGWVRPARLIRGVVISTRERGYVEAARGFGASGIYLVRRHILPELGGLIVTQITVLLPQFILAEVTLSFLGLGISEPVPSWGNMLADARQYFALVSHPWLLAPALLLIPLLFGYLTVADGLLQVRKRIQLLRV